jgi:hypothetical protein
MSNNAGSPAYERDKLKSKEEFLKWFATFQKSMFVMQTNLGQSAKTKWATTDLQAFLCAANNESNLSFIHLFG